MLTKLNFSRKFHSKRDFFFNPLRSLRDERFKRIIDIRTREQDDKSNTCVFCHYNNYYKKEIKDEKKKFLILKRVK
jgi:predicted nucleic-acid-binding Zn-ribbon protein